MTTPTTPTTSATETCDECGALVSALTVFQHREWHLALDGRLVDATNGGAW